MAVEIAKPDSHHRTYSFLKLENGLQAVVGSDAACDKAGAALVVNVGMCHERKDLPGLAHFLEHMLFTGTKKFPKEGEYHEFIQQNGGMANAFTTCYYTTYMFEVKPDALEPAVDRFARFFSEPLLTKDCTDREINAVDSEFQGGLTQPWWRYVGIMNMSANPEHPFNVHCGNNKVLRDDPKERGIDLYEEMLKLYNNTYSANGMTLCIIGKESVESLENIVKDHFSAVLNKGITMPIGDAVSDKPAFLPRDWNRLLLQSPVQDVKELNFSWVLPYQAPFWKTKPTMYPSHLLGYEGEGSVIAVLKQKGLISGCYTGDGAWLEGAFSLFNVNFELTDKGLTHLKDIGTHMFAYIGMLQRIPVEKRIFDEMSQLMQIKFKFGEDQGPFDLCPGIAQSLQQHPPSQALAGPSLLYEYDPTEISNLIGKLTLDSVRVSHQAKAISEQCTEKDTSYDSPMVFLPLENDWISEWSSAMNPGDGSADAAIQAAKSLGLWLPKENPFVPKDLSLHALPPDPIPVPVKLQSSISPVACIYHRQDDSFRQPKAHIAFLIYTPFLTQNVRNYVRAELWCKSVEEALNEYAYDAQVAGMSYSLGVRGNAIQLALAGFNDKLGVLLKAVTEKMKSMRSVPENVFSIVSDSYGDAITNQAFHSPPYQQCSMRFNELAVRGSGFPTYQKIVPFKELTCSDLSGVVDELFGECHIEALALGNVTPTIASDYAHTLVDGLQLNKSLDILPERAEAVLPVGPTVWHLDATDDQDPNHAVFLRLQLPEGLESEVMVTLLDKVLAPKFFDIIRTQQQLGYIVHLGASLASKFVYLIAVVQTEFPPDYVRGRIDDFLKSHFKYVQEELTADEFQTCRLGMVASLRMKPKNLAEEMGRYDKGFADRTYDFTRRQRAIEYLENAVTFEKFQQFARERVQEAPRIFLQVKKTMVKDDKPLPAGNSIIKDPPEMRRWTSHVETVQAFSASTSWETLNSSVDQCTSKL